MANNPYPDSQEAPEETPGVNEQQQNQQDRSKVPAYPYMMQGQQGWPQMDKQPLQPWAPPPGTNTGISGGLKLLPQYDNQSYGRQNFLPGEPGQQPSQPPSMSREQYRDSWMGSGARSMEDLQRFVQQNGGQIVSGNGTVLTPSGEYIDMLTGARTGGNGSAGWTGINGGAGDPRNQGQAGGGQNFWQGGGGSGGGGGSWGGGGSGGGGGDWGSRANGLYDMLMQRAQQGLNLNAKDPIIANQVNSFRAEQTRGVRNNLAQMAEAGGPQNNLNMERRMGNEQAARATGGMQAQLMQNELGARRQEIQNALSQMGGMLDSQQSLALQRELGLIDANLRQQGITNQNNQFLDQFALNVTDRSNYLDALRSGLIDG